MHSKINHLLAAASVKQMVLQTNGSDYWILNNDKLFMIIFDRHNVMISQKSAVAK
ncbi:MAG: hypothetical protein WA421_14810 [Nitrososphaeraceae archaeon]